MDSCDASNKAVTSVLSNQNASEADEALNLTSHGFSLHRRSDVHHTLEDLHDSTTIGSATHPNSTHNPDEMVENSKNYMLSSALVDSPPISHSVYSRPKLDWRRNRQWCGDCGVFYKKQCTRHRKQLIFDKPVLSRAFASLPSTHLSLNRIGLNDDGHPVYGVFAKKTIPKRTQFGPIEGVEREDPPSESFKLLLQHEDGIVLYLDTSDESMSNWMRFVRPADTHKEQNLVLDQLDHCLFFNTIRSIKPKTELRVWYSETYAEKWGLPVLEPNEEEKRALQEQENAWPCFECSQWFTTSEDLQNHLNQHGTNDDSSGLDTPLKKIKTYSRTKITKKSHSVRLKNTLETIAEDSDVIIQKTKGKPPKKYKITSKKEDFKCEICHKSFPHNYSLQRHLKMHSVETKYKCPFCDMKFSRMYICNRHVRSNHKQEAKEHPDIKPKSIFKKKKQGAEWGCTHCNLTFDNSSVLNLHILIHAAEDIASNEENDENEESKSASDEMHKCPECTEEFSHRKDLIEHASDHGKIGKQRRYRGIINPLKPFKCHTCYKSFASEDGLIRHQLVHGSEDSKPSQCGICKKRFLTDYALAVHIKVHSEEKRLYECLICKKEFDKMVAFHEHVQDHCENGVYNCPNCDKNFKEYKQVRKHIRVLHSERRYPCDQCGKTFSRPDKLKMHMLSHSDTREFLCDDCGKQFKRKDKLKLHMERVHTPEGAAKINAKNSKSSDSKKFIPEVPPTDYHHFIYKCHSCQLGFKKRGMLVNHLAKRHPDIQPESVPELNIPLSTTTKNYYCQHCEKVYKSSAKRKAHILKKHPVAELPMSNRQKGGVPEIEGVPNPTFTQTVGSITTDPHSCNWCHKQYASKPKLLQHQRKEHVDMVALGYVPSKRVKVEKKKDAVGKGKKKKDKKKIKKKKVKKSTKDSAQPDSLTADDLLTQAMSELTQSLVDFRSNGNEFLTTQLTQSTPSTLVNPTTSSSLVPTQPTSTVLASSAPSVLEANTTTVDQIQLSQLFGRYQHPQQLSPQQAAVMTSFIHS